ncbi:hypothetical protein EV182_002708, partial [Spiromyces aspiralis]
GQPGREPRPDQTRPRAHQELRRRGRPPVRARPQRRRGQRHGRPARGPGRGQECAL